MKATRLYKDIMKRLTAVPMSSHTREHARTELRRAVSLVDFITGKRNVANGARS
jgi:hypothetical protein